MQLIRAHGGGKKSREMRIKLGEEKNWYGVSIISIK